MNHTPIVAPPSRPRAQRAAKTRIDFCIKTFVKRKQTENPVKMLEMGKGAHKCSILNTGPFMQMLYDIAPQY